MQPTTPHLQNIQRALSFIDDENNPAKRVANLSGVLVEANTGINYVKRLLLSILTGGAYYIYYNILAANELRNTMADIRAIHSALGRLQSIDGSDDDQETTLTLSDGNNYKMTYNHLMVTPSVALQLVGGAQVVQFSVRKDDLRGSIQKHMADNIDHYIHSAETAEDVELVARILDAMSHSINQSTPAGKKEAAVIERTMRGLYRNNRQILGEIHIAGFEAATLPAGPVSEIGKLDQTGLIVPEKRSPSTEHTASPVVEPDRQGPVSEVRRFSVISHDRYPRESLTIPYLDYGRQIQLDDESLMQLFVDANETTIDIPYHFAKNESTAGFSKAPIYRPWHNGAHSARQVKNAEEIMDCLAKHGNDDVREIVSQFTATERFAIKMAAFFLRSGRVDESGFGEGANHAWRSKQIFLTYAGQTNLDEETISLVGDCIPDSCAPQEMWKHTDKDNLKQKIIWSILTQAHHLDLLRFHKSSHLAGEGQVKVAKDLGQYLPKSSADKVVSGLKAGADKRIEATGARSWSSAQFEKCSHDMRYCFAAMEPLVDLGWASRSL